MSDMIRKEFTIVNRLGLHARAAAKLVQTASVFQSEITVEKEGESVNGKSIMGILMLAAPKGTIISLTAEGEDKELAIDKLTELIESGFGED